MSECVSKFYTEWGIDEKLIWGIDEWIRVSDLNFRGVSRCEQLRVTATHTRCPKM